MVEVPIPYDSNLEQVHGVIEEVGKQLMKGEPDVIEATKVDGVEEFGEYYLLLRTLTKVKPGKHQHIQPVLRKAIENAFDREGIEISAPRIQD